MNILFWLKEQRKSLSPKSGITPFRDWRILVIVFFVALVISIGFNIYMSVEINRDQFFNVTTEMDEIKELNLKGLAQVLDVFSKKEMLFEQVKTEQIKIVDPAI